MTLRKKTLSTIVLTLCGLLIVLVMISKHLILGGFADIEAQSTRANMDRVLKSLAETLDELNAKAADWAIWDDTYQFVQDGNEQYVKSNLSDATFTSFRLNSMLFINTSGKVVCSRGFDLYESKVVPVSGGLVKHLSPDSPLLKHKDVESSNRGILMLPEGPMLVVSRPIVTSEGKGPIRGSIVFARLLDDREIKRLEHLTSLPIKVNTLDVKTPANIRRIAASLSDASPIRVELKDAKTISAYGLEKDFYGNPCLLVQVDMARDIYRQGKASVLYFILALVGSGITFGLAMIVLLEQGLLSRLTQLGEEVNGIRTMSDLSARLTVQGDDELSRAVREINGMLEKLEWSQLGMREAMNRFEAIIENTPMVAIQGFDRQGVLRHWNSACRDLYGFGADEVLGRRIQDLILPADAVAEFEKMVAEIWESGKSTPPQEWQIDTRSGEKRWVYSTLVPVVENGKVVEVFCMDVDITDRKAMESKLRDSQRMMSTLVGNLPGMAFRCRSGQYWTMEYVSDGCLELTGCWPTELQQNNRISYAQLVHPDDRDSVCKEVQSAIEDKRTYQIVYRIRTISGDEKWVREQGRGSFDSDGQLQSIEGFISDTTDSKLAEEAIMTSEANYRAIFDAVNEAILIHDLKTGEIIDTNSKACEMFGYEPGELCGRLVEEITARDGTGSNDDTELKMRKAMGGEPQVFEWRGRHKSGEAFWCEVNLKRAVIGGKDRLLAVVRNITERKRAEEALNRYNRELAEREESLRKANTLQQKLLSTAATAIFTVDRDQRITSINESFTAITGYREEDVLGKHCMILEGDPCRSMCGLLDPNRTAKIVKKQCTLMTKDGRRLTVLKSADLVRDDDGNVTGGIESFVDVTELVQAREAAESASKAKSIFLANMSHEIRTPMNGIIGMTDLALDTALSDDQREYLGMVKASADSLLGILNDILDFSKIEAGKLDLVPIDFNLRDSVCDTVSSLGLRAEAKNLELICRVLPDVPDGVIGDPGRLRQIIVNLVGNAIKFTEQGEIAVEVGLESQTRDEVRLHFSVRDTGIGIAKEKQSIIFDAFTQVDGSSTRKYDGTGLGLAISAQLVEMMGGKIWVESEPGRGSTFHFTVCLGLQKQQATTAVAASPDQLRGLSVLVVDDNQTNRLLLEENLQKWGMKPKLAESGSRGLRVLQEAKEAGCPIPLILVDANMPEMDGFEFIEQMKRNSLNDGTVIMLSSAGRRGDASRCEELGISGYLIKPLKPSDLLQAIALSLGMADKAKEGSRLVTRHTLREGRRSLRILLAEDNPVNQKLAVRMLEKLGHTIVVANNGREAVDFLSREKFDLVLMDVQMPEMGGFEATAAIREKEKLSGTHIPIVAMTAHAMKGDREKCLEAGMDDYVTKPVQRDALLEAMDRVVMSDASRN